MKKQGGKSGKTSRKWPKFYKNTPNMPSAVNWNSKECHKIWKKAIGKTEICKKQAQKTSKFQLKQAQKQATRKSSKKPATPQKISPNSRENRKVGNTGASVTCMSHLRPSTLQQLGLWDHNYYHVSWKMSITTNEHDVLVCV